MSDENSPDYQQILAASSTPTLRAESSSRTLTGCFLPFGTPGGTTLGELVFSEGSITVPSDISRIKLFDGHSGEDNQTPIGVLKSYEVRPDGLYGTFYVGTGERGDRVLARAAEDIVNSFSIEASGIIRTPGTREVQRALLTAVAVVPYPAFPTARIDEVHASDPNQGEKMSDSKTTTENVPKNESTPPATEQAPTAPAPDTTPQQTGGETVHAQQRPLVVPGGLGGSSVKAQQKGPGTLRAAELLIGAHTGHLGYETVHAELTDITQTKMLSGIAPRFLGELWDGAQYERQVIPLLHSQPLTSQIAYGYRWKKKPTVAEYAGDKTAIHSTPAELEQVQAKATRWAGGNDLDRSFWDFPNPEILASYWRAMIESYAYETDMDAAKWIVKQAGAAAMSAKDLLRAAVFGALTIRQRIRLDATFMLVNPEDLPSLLEFTKLDVPEFTNITALSDPSKWTQSEFVPKGDVIIGHGKFATFYELGGGSPIRVEAENIAHGGRDAGLFGYTAGIVNRPDGVIRIHLDPAATTPENFPKYVPPADEEETTPPAHGGA